MIQLIVLPRTRLTTLIGRKKLVIYGIYCVYSIFYQNKYKFLRKLFL
ncbi:MAG: hypothetical protein Q8831_00165 ['Bonamia sp.' little leaf phytoplasma]|nr:hypothetical protein ['Bonamia sp.' little leaf phytoplasma]